MLRCTLTHDRRRFLNQADGIGPFRGPDIDIMTFIALFHG